MAKVNLRKAASYVAKENSGIDISVANASEAIKDFVEYLCAPGSGIKPRLNDDKTAVTIHATLGIASEAGEVADAVKKWVAYGREIDSVNLLEEMGDLLHFITMMCVAQGFTLEQVMEANDEHKDI